MKKYKVGYTTGVFDLFHIGHLNILKKSKELCDILIVGVSTDELVKEYKKKIPIIPFDERVKIVESIKYVDYVVPQKSMDKILALKEYKFDVLFVGDDWKNTAKWNNIQRELSNYGVDVVYFPYTKGISSSMLCKKLAKTNDA